MTTLRVDRTIPDRLVVVDALASGPPVFAEGERLERLRPVLYPAWRVTVAYDAVDGEREVVVLLDGAWSGNESELSAYAAGSATASTIDSDERYEDAMVIDDRGDESRARRAIEDWVARWAEADTPEDATAELQRSLGLPRDFAPETFAGIVDVRQLYLPFWVLELATEGETALLSVRSAEPLVSGAVPERDAWLADRLGSVDEFYDRFDSPSPGDAGRQGDGERSADGDRVRGEEATAGDGAGPPIDEGPVQPEGADLSAERLLRAPPGRTFADVGGLDDLKSRLRDTVIRPLRHPERYERYGLGTTTGVLLHGPPGCGKTYVAGALAGELGRWFLPISPTDLTSKWVGEAADNVADAFAVARANQPCLVFVDEIDAVAADRSGRMTNTERQMVNQLLAELEVIGDEDVVVLAATNRLEAIDDAVLRSGRFDERVEVPPPDTAARLEILRVHLQDRPTTADVGLEAVAERTGGLAGSDLALVVERAARAAMNDDSPVGTADLLSAADETSTSIPAWIDSYELGGTPGSFGPAESAAVHQPPGIARDAAEVVSSPPDRGFDAVAGATEVVRTVQERVLDPVLDPDRYDEHDLATVDGALFYGPPGCGKTHIARAVAGEVGCRFVHLRPGDLFGESGAGPAEAVADLFEVARANQPCVLFVDDLHEVSGGGRTLTGRHQRLLTQLATELRAVREAGVLVLGATQLVGDVNETLLTTGAFDERIEVPPPSPETRAGVLRAHVAERLRGQIDWEGVVEASGGYAASDLVLVGQAAARRALRTDGTVDTDDLMAELDRVTSTLAGWEHARRYTQEEDGTDLRYIG